MFSGYHRGTVTFEGTHVPSADRAVLPRMMVKNLEDSDTPDLGVYRRRAAADRARAPITPA